MRLARRIGWSLVVVWVVVTVAFAVNTWLPGDPGRLMAGPQARPADVARIRSQLGLDRPPLVQYARFWKRLLHFGPRRVNRNGDPDHATCAAIVPVGRSALHVDFGKSFQMHQPVVDVVAARVPRTFLLASAGVVLQLVFGLTTGTVAACWRNSWLDRLVVGGSVLSVGVPTFLVALLLQYVFGRELRWLPLDGFGNGAIEHAKCLVLPALTLGAYGAAYYTRLVRDEVSVLLEQEWARTARAKGLPPWRVVICHVLRNALLSVITAVGLDFGALMGGAVVTETVFRWPGLGELSVRALLNRDGPVVFACVVVASIAVVTTNLLVDVLYGRLDPRITALQARDTR